MQDYGKDSYGLWFDEGINRLRIAIVRQAAVDWMFYRKKLKHYTEKYPYCIGCTEYYDCFWTRNQKYGKPSLKSAYETAKDQVEETERFLESDYCEWLCGVEKGYILERLRKEEPKLKKRKYEL